MAESITEGTLKQWSKGESRHITSNVQGSEGLLLRIYPEIGDRVEQDEEIATIETDKVFGPYFTGSR